MVLLQKNVIFLDNNNPEDNYLFVVTVYTGSGTGCGTTSRVALQLVGAETTSKVVIDFL